MRSALALILCPALLAGCGEEILVDGTVGGKSLAKPAALYFGGPFIVITDKALSCMEVSFARRIYDAGQAPTDFDFFGLQFAFDQDTLAEGVFSVEGDAAVASKALLVEGGAFQEFRARTGTLTIDSYEDEDHVYGTFEVGFNDDGELSTSYFEAEWCLNLTR